MNDHIASRMTFQLLRHFYFMKREQELFEARNVNDIKRMVLHHWYQLQKPSETDLRGLRFYDFHALYDYVCSKRTLDAGLYLRMAIAELKNIPTVRSQLGI